MDASSYHRPESIQVLRDRRGLVIGHLKQRSTGKFVARDARGLIVGTYDPKEGTTRDDRGLVIAGGNVLTALLVRR